MPLEHVMHWSVNQTRSTSRWRQCPPSNAIASDCSCVTPRAAYTCRNPSKHCTCPTNSNTRGSNCQQCNLNASKAG
eukprot:m.1640723 g.1640723  ORF g.1640723 m.1640723 type:complete len:76 (-) comp43605_c0_seq1:136-363(-)